MSPASHLIFRTLHRLHDVNALFVDPSWLAGALLELAMVNFEYR